MTAAYVSNAFEARRSPRLLVSPPVKVQPLNTDA